ncbi:MAG TPA: multiheme c-type cytochrome, partial [Vicinamibacteria bacterium]|nr:multiheme c-type cytochrome [Vicinamibacteria bacterium]
MNGGFVHPLPSPRFLAGVAALGAALSAAPLAAQYQYTGPSKCTPCHDHSRQTTRWQKEEPALFKDNAHYNTRKALDAAKSTAYAKAVGLSDSYDLKGSCVTCHSTVFRGDANAGVSCESCHGPGSGYLEPHQVKGSYAKSITLGLRDLKGKPPAIAKACVTCHLTTDRKLLAAGHPSGADFDVGAGLRNVVHWNTTYNYAAVTAAGKAAMGPAAARA